MGGWLARAADAERRPQSAAPPTTDWTKLAQGNLSRGGSSGQRPGGEAPPDGKPRSALLDYYELLEGSAFAADNMLCRPGALAIKATAEVSSGQYKANALAQKATSFAEASSSAALSRPRTAPSAARPPAPLSLRRPKLALARPSTASAHTPAAAAHAGANEPSQPRPSTASATSRAGGGPAGMAGKQKPRMVRRSSSVEATLQQKRLSEANLADSTGPTDRLRMSNQYKARLQWSTGQFEHMKREKSRKLTMELHALAEARLDGYERKFAAFDVQEIASNTKSRPHFHMEQVRQAVKTSIGAQ